MDRTGRRRRALSGQLSLLQGVGRTLAESGALLRRPRVLKSEERSDRNREFSRILSLSEGRNGKYPSIKNVAAAREERKKSSLDGFQGKTERGKKGEQPSLRGMSKREVKSLSVPLSRQGPFSY